MLHRLLCKLGFHFWQRGCPPSKNQRPLLGALDYRWCPVCRKSQWLQNQGFAGSEWLALD